MHNTLYDNLERRILLLDGGFGTMVQLSLIHISEPTRH